MQMEIQKQIRMGTLILDKTDFTTEYCKKQKSTLPNGQAPIQEDITAVSIYTHSIDQLNT